MLLVFVLLLDMIKGRCAVDECQAYTLKVEFTQLYEKPTNAVQQSLSRETNCCSTRLEILCPLGNPRG